MSSEEHPGDWKYMLHCICGQLCNKILSVVVRFDRKPAVYFKLSLLLYKTCRLKGSGSLNSTMVSLSVNRAEVV